LEKPQPSGAPEYITADATGYLTQEGGHLNPVKKFLSERTDGIGSLSIPIPTPALINDIE